MKCIPVQEAVGSILCHDITQILPGEFKGRRFKKGHIIQEEDIPVLLTLVRIIFMSGKICRGWSMKMMRLLF